MLHETMIKDISKWIFAVVEGIAQRLVNKEVLLTRVCGTWFEVMDKLDSSWLPREEGRPQSVGLLTIYEKELDFRICFFPAVGYSLCISIQTDVNSSYAAFSKIQNNFAFSQLWCIPGANVPWTLPFSTFCYFTENLSLFYSCALHKPEWIGTSAKCKQKRKDEKLKIPQCFQLVWFVASAVFIVFTFFSFLAKSWGAHPQLLTGTFGLISKKRRFSSNTRARNKSLAQISLLEMGISSIPKLIQDFFSRLKKEIG